jgi:transcriptional regulator with XRE-family HTH domain
MMMGLRVDPVAARKEQIAFQKDLGRIRKARGISAGRVALLARVSPPRLRFLERGMMVASGPVLDRWTRALRVPLPTEG